jgi:hypothetical protein
MYDIWLEDRLQTYLYIVYEILLINQLQTTNMAMVRNFEVMSDKLQVDKINTYVLPYNK